MERVIILHGLGRRAASMRKLAAAVAAAGFAPTVLDYPSTSAPIKSLCKDLAARLPLGEKLHFVGHSLGGVLAKKLASQLPREHQGRVVQIGAPNFGSEIAVRASPFAPVMGPALAELAPHDGGEKTPCLEVGAIAGTAALPAYRLITGIEGENDGKVSVRSAWGHAQHRLALPVSHSLMMQDKRVIAAVIAFLQNGAFPATPQA